MNSDRESVFRCELLHQHTNSTGTESVGNPSAWVPLITKAPRRGVRDSYARPSSAGASSSTAAGEKGQSAVSAAARRKITLDSCTVLPGPAARRS